MAPQNPKAKITASAQKAGNRLGRLGEGVMRWLLGLTRHWEKRRDIVANNFSLGLTCLKSGHTRDAVLRFKIVTWMEPQRADAWYYLGCSYLAHGERMEAKRSLQKALELQPDYEEATYMLALAGGLPKDKLPAHMPLSLSLSHFEARASGFSFEQVESLGYQGHVIVAEAIVNAAVQGRIDHVVLELGVGTGLLGPLLRPIAGHITGVDMSGAMLAETILLTDDQGKKTYDALIRRELHEFLPGVADAAFDVVAAAGVFSYIGELDGIFRHVARVMKPGALFVFTADKTDGEGFQLDTNAGRFLFSKPYLEGLAQKHGLSVHKIEEAPVYPDYKAWLCVLSR